MRLNFGTNLTVAAAAFLAAASLPAATTTVVVSVAASGSGSFGSPGWTHYTDSGVTLAAGQTATVTASGSWNVCSGSCANNGPDGWAKDYNPALICGAAAPVTSALIGSLNGGLAWFMVGTGPTTVTGPGRLLFSANDWPVAGCPSCFADNAGSLSVTITVTGNGVDNEPPAITAAADPGALSQPNGKMVPITISGRIIDGGNGASGVALGSGAYRVADEYGLVQPSGSFTIAGDGTYRFTIELQARRNGDDKDGREYTVFVNAKDNAGNLGTGSATVIVAHDQGK